jgi:hypothetical protein
MRQREDGARAADVLIGHEHQRNSTFNGQLPLHSAREGLVDLVGAGRGPYLRLQIAGKNAVVV